MGPMLHLAGDRVPPQCGEARSIRRRHDLHSTRLEIGTGVLGVLLLASSVLRQARPLISSISLTFCRSPEGPSMRFLHVRQLGS